MGKGVKAITEQVQNITKLITANIAIYVSRKLLLINSL